MADKKLNPQQQEAIEHTDGPLLIIAGAGTGKTTVITERIKYLISTGVAKPAEILALTFTEKASREMEARVDIAMPYGVTQMWISTFHAFCDRILRSEAIHIGLDPRFNLMTQSETIQLMRHHLFNLPLTYFRPLGNPTKFVDGLLSHFSRLHDEDITPEEYKQWISAQHTANLTKEQELELQKWHELANAYEYYEKIKIERSLMDYGDLITNTLLLFRTRPNVLTQYQQAFKYILVDEFQDTNYSQSQLVYLLASQHKNITVVGDDDQSIYRFRGAAISNILQFRNIYPDSKVVVLTKNYRSSQEILDKAYQLIQHNNPDRLEVVEKVNKKLVSAKPRVSDPSVFFVHESRSEQEAERVCEIIKEITQKEYDYKDIAILVRANNHADSFIKSLVRGGIPHQFLGPGRLFKQPEVTDLVAYLKVIRDIEDSLSLYKVLSIEEFDIEPIDVMKLTHFAKAEGISLFESCERVAEIKINEGSLSKINSIVKGIANHVRLAKKHTAGQVLFAFLEDHQLLSKILNPDTADAEKKAKNVAKFFDKLKTYEVEHEDASVSSVVDWIDLATELGESPAATDTDWTDINAVNILTVHASKGLEFPVVFLVNLVAQRFPSTERSEQIPLPADILKEILPTGDYHLQEERRLFYVGATRAMERLYLTAADYYGEGKREKKLSPFIFETLGEEALKRETQNSTENPKQLSFADYATSKQVLLNPGKPIPAIRIDYLSYSQIETFQTCPLHYKMKYIVGIKTPPTASESLGISIHATLRDFYTAIQSGEKPTQDLLMTVLKKNWITTGYKNKTYQQKSWERAQGYMTGFYANEFKRQKMPLLMEQPFVLTLLQKNKRSIQIGGTIDRVDQLSGGTIEIIDYKTGERVPTQKEVDQNQQLTFYALAASELQDPPFGKLPKDIVLSLYYFQEQKKISTQRTLAQLQKVKEEIFLIREEIEMSDFSCSGNFFCKDCEYASFCKIEQD